MPKNTFFKLPKDKIDKIVEAAIDEFEEYSYENASINRIVESAEIAKGSFYQYFEDKKDLYRYIVGESEKKKLSYLDAAIKKQDTSDYFDSLRDIFLSEVKFAIDLPKLSAINLDFKKNRNIEFKKKILEESLSTDNVFEELILKGIDNKDINDSIDVKLNAFLLSSLNMSILDYFIFETNLNYEKAVEYIENIVQLLKDGTKVKKKTKRNFEDRFY